MNDPRGSIWSKWDLHLHTPGTKLEDGYGGTSSEIWERYIKAIEESDVMVFGITDYFSIDGYKHLSEQKEKFGRLKGKEIFPNIEFRLDQSSNKNSDELNIHIIFDNSLDTISKIETFLSKLPTINTKTDRTNYYCNSKDLTEIGYKKVCVKIDKILDILYETFGEEKRYLIFGVANGYGGIRPDVKSPRKIGIAEELDKCCHVFFARSQDKGYFLKNDRYMGAKKKPVISGSDCHSFEQLDNCLGKTFFGDDESVREITWIKADLTFDGLKQITHEPESRIYIGEIPEKWQKLKENPQLYINYLDIKTKHDDSEWFDNVVRIPLNPDLVSIIGNKGSGKSALADIIAMTSNCDVENYSFLNTDKFLSLPVHKKYEGELTYWNKIGYKKEFSQPDYDNAQETMAVYLSQDFVKNMCEPENIEDLQKEIDRVIFNGLDDEEKGDISDLNELVAKFSSSIDAEIRIKRDSLFNLNEKIIQFEGYLDPAFKIDKERKLKEKQDELDRLEKLGKPKEVKKPVKVLDLPIDKIIEEIKTNINKLQNESDATQKQINERATEKRALLQIQQQVEMYANQLTILRDTIDSNVVTAKYKIKSSDLFLNIPIVRPIQDVIITIESESSGLTKKKEELIKEKESLEIELRKYQSSISAQEKCYQDYQAKLELWDKKKKEIIGDEKIPNSIDGLKRWIRFIDHEAKKRLDDIIKKRDDESESIARLYFKKMMHIENIYGGIRDFTREILESIKIDKREFIEITSGLTLNNDFENSFLSFINQKKNGTYAGLLSGNKEFRKLTSSFDPNIENTLIELPKLLISSLEYDLRLPENKRIATNIDEQLIDTNQKKNLYNLLFGYEYIETRAEITYSGKRLKNLSPGEKGTLLIIFFLLIDRDRRPIIVDQPEENLDNETVFKILVPLIKKVKSDRQIIIVTHNPNLAVVTDSEQIIRSYIDKENKNRITYSPGSIEFHKIRESVVNVLEGTQDAFINRRNKYELKD
jgi:ABC-type lipoprotein export system ATPase subunit